MLRYGSLAVLAVARAHIGPVGPKRRITAVTLASPHTSWLRHIQAIKTYLTNGAAMVMVIIIAQLQRQSSEAHNSRYGIRYAVMLLV